MLGVLNITRLYLVVSVWCSDGEVSCEGGHENTIIKRRNSSSLVSFQLSLRAIYVLIVFRVW